MIKWHNYVKVREGWIWNVKIIRNLQDWEIDEFCNLLQCLDSRKLNDTKDMRVWKPDEKKGFLVRFMYTILCKGITADLQRCTLQTDLEE